MKKIAVILLVLTFALSLVSCGGEKYSKDYYEEIKTYIKNANGLTPPESKDVEYYFYNTINDVTENTYYGYYYTKNGDKLNCAQDKMILPIAYTEGDVGYYFGKVSDSSDWSFVKQINGNWYYFEAHDYIYN